ncbi:unnamed protein product [Tuber melanosporum]|uniref:(Perigord truffle) hypothetical protein n=1 Tax=Tuber melanosporum (strain Mel28) TaxID=656061 RepID=D5GIK4_TUBMM|nr:uncharacterized protein GSTUM_00008537001 [Tuber melanosporum]CAZ84347.1 unnamed protein product [Tuber melanosporum]
MWHVDEALVPGSVRLGVDREAIGQNLISRHRASPPKKRCSSHPHLHLHHEHTGAKNKTINRSGGKNCG